MAGQPQAGAQPLALPHQAPQPAVGADGNGAAVAQTQAQTAHLQAQIAFLQVQIFRLAIAREMAVVNIFLDEYPTSPSVIREQKSQQVLQFNQVYSELPNHIADSILYDKQQHVTRYILSQLWEVDNQEALKWMRAVEYIVGSMFASKSVAVTDISTELGPTNSPSCKRASVGLDYAPPKIAASSDSGPFPKSFVTSCGSETYGSSLSVMIDPKPLDSCSNLKPVACRAVACLRFDAAGSRPERRLSAAPHCARRRHRWARRCSGSPRPRLGLSVRRRMRLSARLGPAWLPLGSARRASSVRLLRSLVPRPVRPSRDFRSRPRCKMRFLPGRCHSTIASIPI